MGGHSYLFDENVPLVISTQLEQREPAIDLYTIGHGAAPPARTPQIVSPVAGALAYIHSRRAIHGNLKPANILIDPQRQPLLADFGFSQGVDVGSRDDAYLSPEQL